MRVGHSGGTDAINTHITQEVTTLARLMKIERAVDGVTTKFTDHDTDITFVNDITYASQNLRLPPRLNGRQSASQIFAFSTSGANALDTETVTIDGRTYTFVTGALDVSGKVKVGATPAITIQNLADAINHTTSGAGVTYNSGTAVHATVNASVVNLANPIYSESTLVGATGVSAHYSNFTSNTGAYYDGDTTQVATGQPKTSGWDEPMWAGVTFNVPRYITHAKVYPTRCAYKTNNGLILGYRYGVPFTIQAREGQLAMIVDGFNVSSVTGTIARLESGSVSGINLSLADFPQSIQHVHGSDAPPCVGGRLLWSLHLGITGSTAPSSNALSYNSQQGQTIAWKWDLPRDTWLSHRIPLWLAALYSAEAATVATGGTAQLDFTSMYKSHYVYLQSDGPYASQSLAQNKDEPITIYTTSTGLVTPSQHAWVQLGLKFPTMVNKWFTLSEVEFYESAETAGSTTARLKVTALATGTKYGERGNAIAVADTVTGGAWGAATLTGGENYIYNFVNGDIITIDSRSYTFITGAFSASGQILVGTSSGISLQNLADAINGTASGAGVTYSTGTSSHATVQAALSTGYLGTLVVTARSTVAVTAGNAITVSANSTYAYFEGSTLSGAESGTYISDPGFSFSSILTGIDQGNQGLEVQMASTTAELLLPDLRQGMWDKARATIYAVNYNAVSGGTVTLFAGRIGAITFDNTGYITINVDNQMSKKRRWPSEVWSPFCRAELGDARCKFPIETLARNFTINTIVNQTQIQSNDLGEPPDFFQNGVMEVLDGPNAGLAVEILAHQSFGTATGAALTNSTATGTAGNGGTAVRKATAWLQIGHEDRTLPPLQLAPTVMKMSYWYIPQDGNTVTVAGKTYTFKTSLTQANNGEVKIVGKEPGSPSNANDCLSNLMHAINRDGSPGSAYSTGTTAHTTVKATEVHDARINFQAIIPGASGNAYGLSSNISHVSIQQFSGGLGASTTGGGAATGAGGTGAVDSTAYDYLYLAQAFPFALTTGTHARIWPGCQKRFLADCVGRFHNAENFRGEPFMPAGDTIKSQ